MYPGIDKAIITLSFDDGRKDTYDVFMSILKSMNIPATINVPTGYIENNYSNPIEIGYNGMMTKEQLDEISKCSIFEIAGHGHMHCNENKDVKKGIQKLKEWYPWISKFGFASPHSELNEKEVLGNSAFYESVGIEYVRLGRNFSKRNLIKRIISKFSSLSGFVLPYVLCYKSSLNSKKTKIIHAIPIIRTTRLKQLKGIINKTIKNKKWCVLEIHSIDDVGSEEYQELFCWDKKKFIELCKIIVDLREKGLIEIKNAMEIVHKEEEYE